MERIEARVRGAASGLARRAGPVEVPESMQVRIEIGARKMLAREMA